MDTYTPRNLRIFNYATNKVILHIEDHLELGKIAICLYDYVKGHGCTRHATAFLDLDDARVTAHQMITSLSTFQKWTDYKGSINPKTGEIISRVLTIERPTDTKIPSLRITIATGPGTKLPTGAVKPAGKLDSIVLLLPDRECLALALALHDHILAWCSATYMSRKAKLWKPEQKGVKITEI
jgi:hypothetical protein